jgi:polyisoprenyl-phosphate glycosyltransferase
MSARVAAIVPAFNEEQTVGAVVVALRSSPKLAEVIVVSDGSTDRTADVARAAGAKVVERPTNGGKGAAVLAGVAATDANVIALFDADLIGLTRDHVDRLLEPVLSGARMMNAGLRDRGWLTPITARLPLISGERVVRRSVIEAIPPRFLAGYGLESALNYRCRSRRMAYGAVPLRGLTIRRKVEKVGFAKGLVQYARMSFAVARAMLAVRLARLFGAF